MNQDAKLFDLNIEKVLEHWELEHALREVIANAIDEQALTSSRPIEIFQDNASRWHTRDYGRGIEYHHFVQNENMEKLVAANLIGKFGVGLKDALAVFWRKGIAVEIHSKFAKITLTMAQKSSFAVKTLHAVFEKSQQNNMEGTEFVFTGITADVIAKAKSMFLIFCNTKCLEKTKYGDVYSTLGKGGVVYVNGVQVAIEDNFLFSYNITNINAAIKKALNRERSNVGRTAYANSVKMILVQCTTRDVLFALVDDLENITRGTNKDESSWIDVSAHAAATLNKKENVVFISPYERATLTNQQVEILNESGKRVVLVPDNVIDRLGTNITTFDDVDEEYQEGFQYEFIAPEQLTPEERDVYDKKNVVFRFLQSHGYRADIPIKISRTTRINSSGNECLGVCENSMVVIKRSVLASTTKFLGVLVHELAHYNSGESDNTRAFENVLTDMLGFSLSDYILVTKSSYANLLAAAQHGTVSDIRFFLDKGENINAKDGNHNTALHYAAWFNSNLAVLEYLIAQGADLNARNFREKTPLDYAKTEEKKRILREAIARRSR